MLADYAPVLAQIDLICIGAHLVGLTSFGLAFEPAEFNSLLGSSRLDAIPMYGVTRNASP